MNDTTPIFRKEEYKWLSRRTSIDLLNLDQELEEHAEMLRQCGECTALAIEIFNRAKEGLQHVVAVVANKYRTEPNNGKAPSETTIESKIPLHDDHQQAVKELQEARLDAELWKNLMSAIEAKGYDLRSGGDLITKGYITRDHLTSRRQRAIRTGTPA